ncbi:Uncharacterised protein [[Flavobacterium] thermophilum]|nr:hypothetical protein GARCT_02002 [Geobacillus sp. 12AMOR1]STO12436.1 Uncharacterised protein [[Flavobacterium] thermophilum]
MPRLFAKSMTTPFMVARGVKNSQKSVAFHNPSVKSCDGGKCHSANLEERNSACRCQETANKTPALGNGYSRCRRRAVSPHQISLLGHQCQPPNGCLGRHIPLVKVGRRLGPHGCDILKSSKDAVKRRPQNNAAPRANLTALFGHPF